MHLNVAKAICLTKNEYDNIESFIRYYGHLFGYNNVHIVDNGSTNEAVLAVYEKYKPLGVTVTVDTTNFTTADVFMTEHIRQYIGTCEWLFLLETDEFVFWVPDMNDHNVCVPKQKIIDYMKSVPHEVSVLRYEKMLSSVVTKTDKGYQHNKFTVPPQNMTKFVDQNWCKIIVRLDRFVRMIQWCHLCEVDHGYNMCVSSELGLAHFHQTGVRRNFERSQQIVKACNYIDTSLPVHMQIPMCKHIIENNVAHYHRFQMYLDTIIRILTCDMFSTFVGRLPTQRELQELVDIDNTEHVILQILRNMNTYKRTHGYADTHDDLVFVEDWKDKWEYHITQVQNTLQSINCDHGLSTVTK